MTDAGRSTNRMKKSESNGVTETPSTDRRESDTPDPPVPPDGGYGWVILFASFIINVLVDGVCFTFGLFYVEFLDYFRESKSKTSWAGSVLNGMYLSMGPITSALCNKFGCRAVTIAGSVLAGVSFLLATFSPNVNILILTYGAMGGAGFGLMYLPAIVMVGFYFEKRRAFATGLAVCGSGIGAFVFAPMCKQLIDAYNWKGALLVISGIVFNGIACGGLFRPLESKPSRKNDNLNCVDDNDVNKSNSLPSCDKNITRSTTSDFPSNSSDARRKRFDSDNPTALLHAKLKGQQSPTNGDKNESNGGLKPPSLVQSHYNLASDEDKNEPGLHKCVLSKSADAIWHGHMERPEIHKRRGVDVSRPMYRKDVFYSGSIVNLPEYQSNQSPADYTRSVTSLPRGSHTSIPQTKGGSFSCARTCQSIGDTFRQMMDFSLLTHPVFVIYGMSCFLCMAGFFIPFIYLPDFAKDLKIDKEKGASLLMILGITNTIGRVLCGWVSDRPWADCLLINNLALVIGGVATVLCPFCRNYILLCIYASIFGLCIAVFVSLRSIIMVELMGLEKLTNAFGLVTLCQGLSAFIGAPIAGALFDATGSYNCSFYVAGATIALAGIICFPLRKVANWYKRREERVLSQTAEYVAVPKTSGPQCNV